LIVAIFIQVGYLVAQYRRDLAHIWSDAIQHGLWRSAKFSQGGKFADYMQFLNEKIPEDGRVVLPPGEFAKPGVLGTTPFMQFFLAPRHVINCSISDCLDGLSRDNTFILVVVDFPDQESLGQEVLMFNQEWGVVFPPGFKNKAGLGWSPFSSLLNVVLSAILPILWLFLLSLAGMVLIQLLLPELDFIIKVALGYGAGLSLFTISLTLMLLLGRRLDSGLVLVVNAAIILSVFFVLLRSGFWKAVFIEWKTFWKTWGSWHLFFLLLAGISFVISVGEGYHRSDEILLWGAKGFGIASEGSLDAITRWGTNTLPYPLHIPLLIAAFRLLFLENLPAGKMVFSAYFLALMLLSYHLMVQITNNRKLSGFSTLLFSTVPLVFLHANIAYANLTVTFYFLAATLLWVLVVERSNDIDIYSGSALCGLFLVAACWSRPEALSISWILSLLWLGMLLFYCRSRKVYPFAVSLLIPQLLYLAFWQWLRIKIYTAQSPRSGVLEIAFMEIRRGNLQFTNLIYIIRSIFTNVINFEIWGVIGVGTLVLFVISIVFVIFNKREINICRSVPLLSGLVYILLIMVIYYFASFDRHHDISWWINTGFDRMLLPGVALVWFGGFMMLDKWIPIID
jgi:hypothetical protein